MAQSSRMNNQLVWQRHSQSTGRLNTGITFVLIPEFQSLGGVVGQNISGLVAGKASMEDTLKSNQNLAERTMKQAGYLK